MVGLIVRTQTPVVPEYTRNVGDHETSFLFGRRDHTALCESCTSCVCADGVSL